jgi:hypothetical protein
MAPKSTGLIVGFLGEPVPSRRGRPSSSRFRLDVRNLSFKARGPDTLPFAESSELPDV